MVKESSLFIKSFQIILSLSSLFVFFQCNRSIFSTKKAKISNRCRSFFHVTNEALADFGMSIGIKLAKKYLLERFALLSCINSKIN